MKHDYSIKYETLSLRPLCEEDIEKLRIWRNDSRNNQFLRNIGEISKEAQKKWYMRYLDDETEMIFAIIDYSISDELVGSVSLYNIQENVAEVGKILIGDTRAHGKGIGRKALALAMEIGFRKLNLSKIVGAVSPDNIQAYTNDMRVGFEIVGEHILENGILEKEIEINVSQLHSANEYLKNVLE